VPVNNKAAAAKERIGTSQRGSLCHARGKIATY